MHYITSSLLCPTTMRLLLLALLVAPMATLAQARWMMTIPDQNDSQQVDLGSITSKDGEWIAWTRSPLKLKDEEPVGRSLMPGEHMHLKMAVRCLPNAINVRAVEVQLVDTTGKVVFERNQNLQADYPSYEGMEYANSAPGLICAAALAQRAGKSLPWPMRKSEHRAFVNKLL